MLTYFRKIRKSFINSNELRKYILYAIGEIVLVVIGILIALQINNWNEEKKNRELEKILLAEIHNEFNYNLREFHENITVYREGEENLRKINNLWPFSTSMVSMDSLSVLFGSTNFVGNFDVSLTSLEKLKSTFSFNIISNNDLKNLLLKFEVLSADYTQTEQEYLDFHNQIYIPRMNKEIIFPHHRGVEIKEKDDKFLNSMEFKNLIRYKRGKMTNMFRTADKTEGNENIIRVMEKIISLSKAGLE